MLRNVMCFAIATLLGSSLMWGGELKKEAEPNPGFTMCGNRVITEGELKVLAQCDDAAAYINTLISAMEVTGFKEVHGLPICNEQVRTEKRTVKLDGVAYEWKAIVYVSDRFENRYVARLLTNLTTKAEASRTEEFRLFIRNQIPLAYHGGGWLPSRASGPVQLDNNVTSQWITYPGTVTDVETLNDGRVVKHVASNNGACPYFVVEKLTTINTTTTEKRIIQVPVTLTRDADESVVDGGGTVRRIGKRTAPSSTKYTLPDEKALRDSGAIKAGEILVKVVGVTEVAEVKSDEIDITPHFQSKEVTVEIPIQKSFVTNVVYYYDAGK